MREVFLNAALTSLCFQPCWSADFAARHRGLPGSVPESDGGGSQRFWVQSEHAASMVLARFVNTRNVGELHLITRLRSSSQNLLRNLIPQNVWIELLIIKGSHIEKLQVTDFHILKVIVSSRRVPQVGK